MSRPDWVHRAADSGLVDRLARVGFAARGTTYLLMGWIALQLGFDRHPREAANQRGAFQELDRQRFGHLLLLLMVIGLGCYVVFRGTDAVLGERGEHHGLARWVKRVGSAGRAIGYGSLTYSAVAVLAGINTSAGNGSGAGLLTYGWGRWAVAAIGAGLVVGGAAQAAVGVSRRFSRHLKLGQMSQRTRAVVVALGAVGTTARGVVFGLIGVFFLDAAWSFDPDEAKGLDQSLRELLRHRGGRTALIAMGAGLVVFGSYSWCEARWRRTGREHRAHLASLRERQELAA